MTAFGRFRLDEAGSFGAGAANRERLESPPSSQKPQLFRMSLEVPKDTRSEQGALPPNRS